MSVCYIFCALKCSFDGFLKNDGDLLIAADAGFDRLFEIGVTPDLCVGDFDSAKEVPDNVPIIRHPKRKDDTDLLLAVKIGLKRGFKSFVIFGALGGRLDQTVASVQTAVYIAEHGGTAVFSGDSGCLTAVKNGTVEFKKKSGSYVSVFSHSEKSCGVTLKGFSYTLNNAELTNSFPLGVSNEFTGENAHIGVTDGTLVVIWEGSFNDLLQEKTNEF